MNFPIPDFVPVPSAEIMHTISIVSLIVGICNPALLPCEFDAMATMMIDETTVAIVDFFIIPTYSGRSPNRIADIVVFYQI